MAGSELKASSIDTEHIFRLFTACPHDIPTIVIDVRPHKEFKAGHIAGAFCVRLSSNGAVLADYSQASYPIKWSQDCWWGRDVLVYGDVGLKRDHPVIRFLAAQGKCRTLSYYKDGLAAFEKAYPSLVTTSLKSVCIKKYPSQILPNLLYLGDWEAAADGERLGELRIRRIVTVHNHPERLTVPAGVRHLRLPLPDIEDADISSTFAQAYEFIHEGVEAKQPVLVHCGAGVSRSATLAMMYLMRRNGWSAQRARDYVVSRRSMVCINDGFWAVLCALEGQLGVSERSDPNATWGFRGADAPPAVQQQARGGGGGGERSPPPPAPAGGAGAVTLSRDAAGERVAVRMLSAKEAKEEQAGGGDGGAKRAREGDAREPDAKRRPGGGGGSDGGGVTLTFAVHKPEGLVGQLVLGPMRFTQRVLLGRSPDADVVLEHASISRHHAAITVDRSGAASVADLGSAHGTKVGDTWIKPNTPRQLQVGATLSFGASTRTYRLLSVAR